MTVRDTLSFPNSISRYRLTPPIRNAGLVAALIAGLVYAAGPSSAQGELRPAAVASPSAPAEPTPDWIQRETAALGAAPADESGSVEMFVQMAAGDDVEELLVRAGAIKRDAVAVAQLVAPQMAAKASVPTELAILFGNTLRNGGWEIERVTLRPDLGPGLRVAKGGSGAFQASEEQGPVGQQAVRISGRVANGLYWSLRSAGVPAETATEYLDAISKSETGSAVTANDSFDLVLARQPGSRTRLRLLYAGLDRNAGRDVQLVKWAVGDRTDWFDPNVEAREAGAMIRPVSGRVTSGFGYRIHPILRFGRFHRGVDFQAPMGAPVVAATAGRVIWAGWNGGYGRQVRIAHAAGVQTTYAHMSDIVAPVGAWVAKGQVIGRVGSSGFSTGPHLHYEVIAGGRAIDPISAQHLDATGLDAQDLPRLKARLAQLLAIGGNQLTPGKAGRVT